MHHSLEWTNKYTTPMSYPLEVYHKGVHLVLIYWGWVLVDFTNILQGNFTGIK